MKSEFNYPLFNFNGKLELRFEHDVVCVYGTEEGLSELIVIIQELIDNPNMGHIHLEDRPNFLTKESKNGAVAIFD
ncbi:MAG: hypothetical protein R3F48_01865 [Candidatus Zixiibacteriota bacterium]